eukprot:TRINITY_DN4181_c0_g1_i1.p1 TRINITY_DN4181_c0_g1~~TRINITY_DN4181_c0_g1_i1.p1  ORF type:complete len:509 (-),score=60.31 TRINITY_DN4181_c0_g1_i1:98-1624(-)
MAWPLLESARPRFSSYYQQLLLGSNAFVDRPLDQEMELNKSQSLRLQGRSPRRKSFVEDVVGDASFGETSTGPKDSLNVFNSFREVFIGIVILVNFFTIALELDYPWDGWVRINLIFFLIYFVDLVFLLAYHGTRFPFSWWNWGDVVVVATGVVDMVLTHHIGNIDLTSPQIAKSVVYAIRLVRLLKVVRVFSMMPWMRPLSDLLSGVSAALRAIMWLLFLIFFFLYSFALIFTVLFGHGVAAEEFATEEMREHAAAIFATVPLSLFALFRSLFSNVSDFGNILQDTAGGLTVPLFYVTFQVGASWVLFSTVTAAVVDNVTKVTLRNERELEFLQAQASKAATLDCLMEFLSNTIELTPYDEITREALITFLNDPGNLGELRRIGGVDRAHAFNIWEALEFGGTVDIDVFVEKLVTNNNLEYVAAGLDARIRKLQMSVDQSQVYLPKILEAISGSSGKPLSLSHKPEGEPPSLACTLCGHSSGLSSTSDKGLDAIENAPTEWLKPPQE